MTGELLRARDVIRAGQKIEFYLDDDFERYTSRIVDIIGKNMVVEAPRDKMREELALVPMTEMKALVVGKECRYSFSVVFQKYADRRNGIHVWYVSRPERVARFQSRDYVRVKLDHTVQVRLVDDEGTISDPLYAPMVDLSGNGLCFALDRVVLVGTQVGLEIDNIPDMGTIDVMGRVVCCWAVNPKEERPIYHVGVSLGELPRAAVNKIVHYLFSVQRNSIAKGVPEGGWKA